MAPRRRRCGDPPPQYGPLEECFSVEINHGGMFCGYGINKTYVDCRIEYFDDCDVDSWSPLWLKDFVGQLGYDPQRVQIYWLLPGKSFSDGLRIIESDADTLMMTAVVPKFQHFKLYVNEEGLFDGINIDDICIDGSADLPPVMSPKPADTYGVRGLDQSVGDDMFETDDSDSDFGDDLIDSDNEVDKDDDDLHEEWADGDTVAQTKKGTEMDDDYESDELELPESDSDYEQEDEEETEEQQEDGNKKRKKKKRVKLRPFRPEDMQAPTFRLGMVFPTVVELRMAIQEYIIQNRRKIKFAKNDLQRVRAHCAEGCPWYLFAAPDSRTKNSFVVKTYVGTHTCEREWELKLFTAQASQQSQVLSVLGPLPESQFIARTRAALTITTSNSKSKPKKRCVAKAKK